MIVKSLLSKLHNKYYYKLNFVKETLHIGSVVNVQTIKGRGRRVFLGILLKIRKRKNFITITLRNSFKKYTFEKSILLSNSIIKEIRFLKNAKIITKRNNLYYIRKRKRTLSTF